MPESPARTSLSAAPSAGPGTVATHCPYCALQCGMLLSGDGAGHVTVQARDFPTNRGGLCQKGWTSADLLTAPDRLSTPLVRRTKGGELEPATWEEALDKAVQGIRGIQRRAGRDAVAVFGGGGLTNEKAYLLGKFARVALGTAAIDYNGRFCMSSAAAAGLKAFGLDRGMPFPLADIAEADTVLLAGGNPAETMPPFARYLTEQRRVGGELIVIDPRRTPTAAQATLHLRPAPGTDLALANGLLHIVVNSGLLDETYVALRTNGFDEVRRAVAAYWPERVERITGVPVADQHRAARLLGAARRAVLLTGRGAEQHSKGTDTVSAFINLALALGLPGTPGSGYACLTGQGNGQGGREHGQKADQLPGYRRIDDPAARRHIARIWGVDPDGLPGAGPSAYELLDALGTPGGAQGLLVLGSNPVVSAPNARHVEERLRSLELLVVADPVLSETAALADVVLPSAQWAEEDGTMTNLEGRVLRRRRLRPPPPGVRTDLTTLSELARKLGHPTGFPADPAAAFEELRQASRGGPADYSGITYDHIDRHDGVFWPAPAPPAERTPPTGARPHAAGPVPHHGGTDATDATDATDGEGPRTPGEASDTPGGDPGGPGGGIGTPRMFLDAFAHPDGRARFVAVEHRPAAEEPDSDHPLHLTTGRIMQHYQSGAQTRRVPALAEAAPRPFVEVHPDLARRLGVSAGEPVRVVSRRGSAEAEARVTSAVRPDTVFMPFHWGGAGRANTLVGDALDPLSRMPEFKVSAVRLERI
ncbi:molybdopterin-dependent oxidoreductase [Streptomyces sp. LHD-70]|uniref:molybdopterin oxidoreductase family protein n=1 Tax=Streptomyces sp. LHD-70 TaxID=3072140 RepID=UPI00280F5067|nr:molybdopterin-dependent oxidoreductase [Streptomyces sp. LHD-70]MDQ8701736.1 molybdopterin-dependent oxidoreductase [Streptomyces sp. LHD-70]